MPTTAPTAPRVTPIHFFIRSSNTFGGEFNTDKITSDGAYSSSASEPETNKPGDQHKR